MEEKLDLNVIPVNYNIFLEPDLRKFEFKGVEKITIEVKKKTKIIKLHSKDLKIKSAFADGRELKVKTIEKTGVVLFISRSVLKGRIKLEVNFNGRNGDLKGFYKSDYLNNGKKEWLLTTQFEAADARAAFPCFDEPCFKATFNLSVLVDKNLEVISNTEIKKIESKGSKKLVVFNQTPVMSTYLLYLGVGKFEFIESSVNGIRVRVYTTPEKLKLAKLPLEYAKKSIAFFEGYFKMKYQLPKLDLIALPDFSASAMENWGAITFRETALLCDENTSLSNRQNIAMVIAHEISHQWFGDLVTMKWWDDLWLNESFATFAAYRAVEKIIPEWKFNLHYLLDVVDHGMVADSLISTHPVSVKIKSAGDIEEIFDSISYEKGSSVLRMFEDFIGEKVFRESLHDYLKRHSYANASKNDLWLSIKKTSEKRGVRFNVSMIEEWINKPGYPMVRVEKTEGGFNLTEKRFTLLEDKKDFWTTPVHYATSEGEGFTILKKKQFIKSKSDWIKINFKQPGFYRALYQKKLVEKLGVMIKNGGLSDVDAWGVENDLFVTARSGRIELKAYLEFVQNFCMEFSYPLSDSILTHLSWVLLVASGDKSVEKTVDSFSENLLDHIGWSAVEKEEGFNKLMRSKALTLLGLTGNERAVEKAERLFENIRLKKKVDSDLKGFAIYIKTWVGVDFSKLAKMYEVEQNPLDKMRVLQGLGMFKEKQNLLKALKYSESEKVKHQDSFRIPAFVSSNPVGKKLIWGWIKKNWVHLKKRNQPSTHFLGHFVSMLSVLDTSEELNEVKNFFKKNNRDDIKRTVKETLERIECNARFKKLNGLK
jgi:tricorn protease interacting factor F2/3